MSAVAFSYDIFSAQRVGGVGRSMIELARALSSIHGEWWIWSGENDNAMLDAARGESWANDRIIKGKSRHPSRVIGSIRNEPEFARWLSQSGVRLIHRTYYPIIDLVGNRARIVETLHDMWDERSSAIKDPEVLLRSALKKRALQKADLIVCVSEATRSELGLIWPWAEAKSVVIPHGVRPLSKRRMSPPVDRPFFLFVGRRGLYKNFGILPEALRRACLSDHLLVCFGGGAFNDMERRTIARAGLTGRVIQVDGDDDKLAGSYEAATALLYPSTYEGFGLPLLEAMTHNCPVVASPLTSLPEVGGDAACYAEARDPDAWAAMLVRLAEDGAFRSNLQERGRKRANEYDWSRTAEAYSKHYQALS